MKLDELKVTQKYSSIIPNAETEKHYEILVLVVSYMLALMTI